MSSNSSSNSNSTPDSLRSGPVSRAEDSGILTTLQSEDVVSTDPIFGKYSLLGVLGSGGMATVYLAVADGPEGFRKLCVVKTMKEEVAADDDFRAMFLDEARLAARLNHPHIVQTYEVDELEGHLFLAMEYVEGQPLHRILRRVPFERLPLGAKIRILADVLEALSYAHSLADFDGTPLGIVHRDISPHNVIVGYDGRVKLLDFGIAKSAAAEQMTQAGVVKGKVGYMAPEQARLDRVDARADVFPVGVMLWECVTGRRFVDPKAGREVLGARIAGTEARLSQEPGVDPELARMCDRAMATRVDDRYPDAAAFQTDLEAWLAANPAPPRKVWAQTISELFGPERKKLQAVIEQRMSERLSSTSRPVLSASGVLRASTLGQRAIRSSDTGSGATGSHSQSASGKVVTVPPPESKGRGALVAAAAIGLLIAGGGGFAASRMLGKNAAASVSVTPTTGAPATAPTATAIAAPPSAVASTSVSPPGAATPSPAPTAPAATTAGKVPVFHGTKPVDTATKTPPKPGGARSLDEKDPYAP
jgi:serine/threonine protein kinase